MVETERLLLRRWEADDLDAVARMNADADVMRYIAEGRPVSRADSASFLNSLMLHWEEHGFGLWAAVDKSSGELAGAIGLTVPTFLPAVLPAVEVGRRLDRRICGRGGATDGGRPGLRYRLETLGLERIVSIILSENEASIRVAEKLGLALERQEVHARSGHPLLVYAIERDGAG